MTPGTGQRTRRRLAPWTRARAFACSRWPQSGLRDTSTLTPTLERRSSPKRDLASRDPEEGARAAERAEETAARGRAQRPAAAGVGAGDAAVAVRRGPESRGVHAVPLEERRFQTGVRPCRAAVRRARGRAGGARRGPVLRDRTVRAKEKSVRGSPIRWCACNRQAPCRDWTKRLPLLARAEDQVIRPGILP